MSETVEDRGGESSNSWGGVGLSDESSTGVPIMK